MNKLKETRKEMGLTQEELAKKADVSRTIISGLESGKAEVTTTGTLKKLALALNSDVATLFFS